SGLALANEFDSRLDHLTKTLDWRGRDLLQQFETRATALDTNTEKLNAALNQRAKQLNETLVARARQMREGPPIGQQTVTGGLDHVLQSMNAALDEKGAQFRQSLKNAADDTVMDLDLRTGFFDERMQATVGQIASAFDHRVEEFAQAFDQRAGSLDSKLMESLARINETVASGHDTIDGILTSSIDRLGNTLNDQ